MRRRRCAKSPRTRARQNDDDTEPALSQTARGPPCRKPTGSPATRSVSDPDALAAYAKLAGPAIAAGGGRFLARGTAAHAYEDGLRERTVLIEFDSVEQAVALHDSAAYQEALKALGDGAVRDLRIVPGAA
jgi:uncharacterized protein (DUF1330 family)